MSDAWVVVTLVGAFTIAFKAAGPVLLGDRIWYLPSWLAWLPRIEGEKAPEAPPALVP